MVIFVSTLIRSAICTSIFSQTSKGNSLYARRRTETRRTQLRADLPCGKHSPIKSRLARCGAKRRPPVRTTNLLKGTLFWPLCSWVRPAGDRRYSHSRSCAESPSSPGDCADYSAHGINDYSDPGHPHIQERWASYFRRLGEDPPFQRIQLRHVRPRMNTAADYARQFGLRSERGLAFMFDVVTQHGGGWLDSRRCQG